MKSSDSKSLFRRLLYDKEKIDKNNLMFSNAALKALLIPLIIEQVLNQLMGVADTMMGSRVGSVVILALTPLITPAGDVKFSMISSGLIMWLLRVSLCVFLIRVQGFGPIAVWIAMFLIL